MEDSVLSKVRNIGSRGGVPSAKLQLHRARAFFDTLIIKYPDASFGGVTWGEP